LEVYNLILKIKSYRIVTKRGHVIESFTNGEHIIKSYCIKCGKFLHINKEKGGIFGYIVFNDCTDTKFYSPNKHFKKLVKFYINLFLK
jgi:hypothetical protein